MRFLNKPYLAELYNQATKIATQAIDAAEPFLDAGGHLVNGFIPVLSAPIICDKTLEPLVEQLYAATDDTFNTAKSEIRTLVAEQLQTQAQYPLFGHTEDELSTHLAWYADQYAKTHPKAKNLLALVPLFLEGIHDTNTKRHNDLFKKRVIAIASREYKRQGGMSLEEKEHQDVFIKSVIFDNLSYQRKLSEIAQLKEIEGQKPTEKAKAALLRLEKPVTPTTKKRQPPSPKPPSESKSTPALTPKAATAPPAAHLSPLRLLVQPLQSQCFAAPLQPAPKKLTEEQIVLIIACYEGVYNWLCNTDWLHWLSENPKKKHAKNLLDRLLLFKKKGNTTQGLTIDNFDHERVTESDLTALQTLYVNQYRLSLVLHTYPVLKAISCLLVVGLLVALWNWSFGPNSKHQIVDKFDRLCEPSSPSPPRAGPDPTVMGADTALTSIAQPSPVPAVSGP